MKTEIIKENIAAAAEIIRKGGLAAVPTETVYGLAANGLDAAAVEKIYAVKGRSAEKPLSLMVPGAEAIERLCEDVPPAAYALAERFWPGPVTIVLKAKKEIPSIVRAGGETVGLRCPASEKTLRLLKACGVPLAAPSANPSGAESPKTAEAVMSYFDGKIDAVIDGGECALGRESTVVDLSARPWRVLRQGAVSEEEIRQGLIASLRVFGVTGGTGTGKTTALDSLAAMGALVIDADGVYHGLCQSSAEMLEKINARFPGTVIDGALQRKALGNVVFSDGEALEDLRSITDRYVEREIDRLLANHAAAGGRYAAVDAINLLDTPLMAKLTATVGIVAPEEDRVRRLMAREGISEEYALLRIRAQKSAEYFEENCDYIIRNDGSMEEYRQRCDELFSKLLKEKKNHG